MTPRRSAEGPDITIHFRPTATDLLAGGPVELDTVLQLAGGDPVTVTTSVERATGRSRDYRFVADAPDGSTLTDPYAGAMESGGVQTSDLLTAAEPLRDTVLLNQFLGLERLRTLVADGETYELLIHGVRAVHLAGGDAAERGADSERRADSERSADIEFSADSEFTVPLRRDDAALRAELLRIAESVRDTTADTTERARQVLVLTSIRDPIAADALTIIIGHPDANVSAMARQALTTVDS